MNKYIIYCIENNKNNDILRNIQTRRMPMTTIKSNTLEAFHAEALSLFQSRRPLRELIINKSHDSLIESTGKLDVSNVEFSLDSNIKDSISPEMRGIIFGEKLEQKRDSKITNK